MLNLMVLCLTVLLQGGWGGGGGGGGGGGKTICLPPNIFMGGELPPPPPPPTIDASAQPCCSVWVYLDGLFGHTTSRALYCRLRARRALTLFNNIPLRTRRALSPQTLYSDSPLLVLNGTSLNNINALLALN